MPMETTLVLVKPDGVQRGLVGRILARFEDKGLQVAGLKMMRCSKELLEKHYEAHRARPFFPGLVEFMGSGPVVALALRGHGVIEVVRRMMGKTAGAEADPGTIRGDLGMSRSFNLVHGSDSADAARREIDLFFGKDGLFDYTLQRLGNVYDPREER